MRLLISLAVVLLSFSVSLGQIYLDDISVSKQGDSVAIDIKTTKPCLYEHFMIKDAPEKIVVDLKGTINNWPRKRFDNLPFGSFERIRTSQFQVKPELVTRVVLDVNRAIGYRVEELPLGVRIKIPASDNEQEFAIWHTEQNAKPVKIASKPKPKSAPAKPPKPEKKKVVTKVEDFPKRKTIKYQPKTNRDPFKTLVGQGSTIMTGQSPSVENLTLVGVFDDDTGRKALFEDAEGNGFILKPNDRVQNGYLVSIYKDKAIFQITEYGWTRTVALSLQMPELR